MVAEPIALHTAGIFCLSKRLQNYRLILTFSTGLLKRMTPIEFTRGRKINTKRDEISTSTIAVTTERLIFPNLRDDARGSDTKLALVK